MKSVFADAVYWIALLNQKDSLHQQAVTASRSLGGAQVVTTEMVLTELLNAFAERGPEVRFAAARLVVGLRRTPILKSFSRLPRSSMKP